VDFVATQSILHTFFIPTKLSVFKIDPDIRKARTIDTDFYTCSRHFHDSKEKIFSRSWHFLGHLDDLDQLTPSVLLPGFLDEPVLTVKSEDGVSCISNVCTHRAKLLIEEPCQGNLIRCRYHGRRFDLGGKMISMPEFDEVEDFPSESDNLPSIACGSAGGFFFASINPTANLFDFCEGAESVFDRYRSFKLELVGTRDYLINAHWALYCENYLEGFHLPYVHRSLNEVVDYGNYRTDLFRYSSLQTGYDMDGGLAASYLFVFPNLMFNIYPWGISVNVVRPIAPDRTVVEFRTYAWDKSLMNEGAGADLHSVELEDEAVVESVQKGVRSRFYRSGRYSPSREQGTHHFHRLIAEFMNPSS
jgi:choline monooxygenase